MNFAIIVNQLNKLPHVLREEKEETKAREALSREITTYLQILAAKFGNEHPAVIECVRALRELQKADLAGGFRVNLGLESDPGGKVSFQILPPNPANAKAVQILRAMLESKTKPSPAN